MRDPYVHDTKTSPDSTKATETTSNPVETPSQVRVSNNRNGKHQALQVSLSDSIVIATILTRRSDVREQPPRQSTDRPQQTFVSDEKPRKRRMVEIVMLVLILLTAAVLFFVPSPKPTIASLSSPNGVIVLV
jgi:hypothetical protein